MKLITFYLIVSSSCFLLGQGKEQLHSDETAGSVNTDLFNSSFFDGLLDQANSEGDAMGIQRLVDLRGSSLTPSINFSTSYNIVLIRSRLLSIKKIGRMALLRHELNV